MNGVQSRLVCVGLERLDEENEGRRANASRYRTGLDGLEGLDLPPDRLDSSPVFPYFPVLSRTRAELLQWMLRKGRDVATHNLRNCADLPIFSPHCRDCPNARRASRSLILLPTYPRYPMSEIDRNIEVIRAFFSKPAPGRVPARTPF